MERQSVLADELARKVDYVRDWLNKAEEAIRNGNTIDAVAKLSLAKADTTFLISTLMPQTKEVPKAHRAGVPSFTWHKLAMLAGPLVLIGCFLLGLAVGGSPPVVDGVPSLNAPFTGETVRSVERPTVQRQLLALATISTDEPEPTVSPSDEMSEPIPAPSRRVTVAPPVKVVAPAKTSSPVEIEPAEAAVAEEEAPSTAPVEDLINLFDFGLNVIRSARENMGR